MGQPFYDSSVITGESCHNLLGLSLPAVPRSRCAGTRRPGSQRKYSAILHARQQFGGPEDSGQRRL